MYIYYYMYIYLYVYILTGASSVYHNLKICCKENDLKQQQITIQQRNHQVSCKIKYKNI